MFFILQEICFHNRTAVLEIAILGNLILHSFTGQCLYLDIIILAIFAGHFHFD